VKQVHWGRGKKRKLKGRDKKRGMGGSEGGGKRGFGKWNEEEGRTQEVPDKKEKRGRRGVRVRGMWRSTPKG